MVDRKHFQELPYVTFDVEGKIKGKFVRLLMHRDVGAPRTLLPIFRVFCSLHYGTQFAYSFVLPHATAGLFIDFISETSRPNSARNDILRLNSEPRILLEHWRRPVAEWFCDRFVRERSRTFKPH